MMRLWGMMYPVMFAALLDLVFGNCAEEEEVLVVVQVSRWVVRVAEAVVEVC